METNVIELHHYEKAALPEGFRQLLLGVHMEHLPWPCP